MESYEVSGAAGDAGAAGFARRLDAATSAYELARLLVEEVARYVCSVMRDGAGRHDVPSPRAVLRGWDGLDERLAMWLRTWERVAVVAATPAGPLPDCPGAGGGSSSSRVAARIGWAASRLVRIRRSGVGLLARRQTAWHHVGVVVDLAAALIALASSIGPQPVARPPAVAPPAVAPSPPGRRVVDDGRAFGAHGSSGFTVTVDPANAGVRLTRRLDAGIGMQTAAITVNGAAAGRWAPLAPEVVHRWVDQSVDLPPRLTAGRRSLVITTTFVSSSQDFNEFAYFVEQRVHGVWSRADALDVGPDHPDDEAAHHYHVTGQTWAGTRDFTYER